MRLTICCFLLLTAFGCGDDGRFSTGIDRSRLLSSVTDAEARAACERNSNVQPDLSRRDICEFNGVFSTTTPEECEAFVTSCLAAPEEPDEPTDCSDADADGLEGCDATVGDLEDCANDSLDARESFVLSVDCSDTGTELTPPGEAPSCARLEMLCPDDEMPSMGM